MTCIVIISLNDNPNSLKSIYIKPLDSHTSILDFSDCQWLGKFLLQGLDEKGSYMKQTRTNKNIWRKLWIRTKKKAGVEIRKTKFPVPTFFISSVIGLSTGLIWYNMNSSGKIKYQLTMQPHRRWHCFTLHPSRRSGHSMWHQSSRTSCYQYHETTF